MSGVTEEWLCLVNWEKSHHKGRMWVSGKLFSYKSKGRERSTQRKEFCVCCSNSWCTWLHSLKHKLRLIYGVEGDMMKLRALRRFQVQSCWKLVSCWGWGMNSCGSKCLYYPFHSLFWCKSRQRNHLHKSRVGLCVMAIAEKVRKFKNGIQYS